MCGRPVGSVLYRPVQHEGVFLMKVTYKDHMGTDLSVVNAARVSFGKESEWAEQEVYGNSMDAYPTTVKVLSKADKSLIQFLARGCTSGDWGNLNEELMDEYRYLYDETYGENGSGDCTVTRNNIRELLNHIRRMPPHWTPFGHTAISLHIKAPIFVARQLGKHQVGFIWNEVSRRYVTDKPEFYMPETWRKTADNVKQGSSDEGHELWNRGKGTGYVDLIHYSYDDAFLLYERMMSDGVCPEQARMVLPQSMYTEWWMTGNLYAWANLFNQRTDSHTQRETQEVAKQIGDIIEPLFPESWKALTQ